MCRKAVRENPDCQDKGQLNPRTVAAKRKNLFHVNTRKKKIPHNPPNGWKWTGWKHKKNKQKNTEESNKSKKKVLCGRIGVPL